MPYDPKSSASALPVGTIIAWWAKRGAFPIGWAVCDGSNNTPNLKGRFIRGAEGIAEMTGIVRGAESHQHHFAWSVSEGNLKGSDFHWGSTPWCSGPNPVRPQSGSSYTDPAENLPPCIDIIYLMKV